MDPLVLWNLGFSQSERLGGNMQVGDLYIHIDLGDHYLITDPSLPDDYIGCINLDKGRYCQIGSINWRVFYRPLDLEVICK